MKRGVAAAWLIPCGAAATPIRDGALLLDEREVILDVGPEAELRARYPDVPFEHQRAILMPGLVNAHTHLELSGLRGHTRPGGGFGPWLRTMMAARQRLSPEQDHDAIEAAIGELLRSGTVAVGEVSNSLSTVSGLGSAPLAGVVFHEVFGVRRESATAMRALAREARERLPEWPANLRYVPAPHTLYSLHPSMVQELVAEARRGGQRTSLHLAEHAAEVAFLRDGSGPFRTFLEERGVEAPDWAPPGLSPVAYAAQLGVLGPDAIAVHLCAAPRDDLDRVAAAAMPVVLCPRSNLFIELKLPPLYDVLKAGIRPGLGTDSLASNTTLDVLAEAAALADRFPQVDPLELLRMATYYGACALGLGERLGALSPGFAPGVIAFELAGPVDEPARHLLRHPSLARRVLSRPNPRPPEDLP